MIRSLNKIIFISLLLLNANSVLAVSESKQISSASKVIGSIPADASGAGNGGKLVFPFTGGTIVDGRALVSDPNADIGISGNFWLQNLSVSSTDLGWATFDFNDPSLSAYKAKLVNNRNGTFDLKGCAWSKAAGWICFGDSGVTGGRVVYDRIAGIFNGCGWSKNIGWVCFGDGTVVGSLKADTMPPAFDKTIFAADDDKNLIIDNDSRETYKVRLDRWSSSDNAFYTRTSTFNHDFRAASRSRGGDYSYEIVDDSGNSTTGKIHVTADKPGTLNASVNIGGSDISNSVKTTQSSILIANGSDKHTIGIKLRDQYGNLVVNDEVANKRVIVSLNLKNGAIKNQMPVTSPLSNPANLNNGIIGVLGLGGTDFGLNPDLGYVSGFNNLGIDGNYDLTISSNAPSDLGFGINLDDISLSISSGVPGNGELSGTQKLLHNEPFYFSPAFGVNNVVISGGGWNNISVNNSKTFTDSYFTKGTSISDVKVANILDILNTEYSDNVPVSFQDSDTSPDSSKKQCIGYNKNIDYITEGFSENCTYASILSSNLYSDTSSYRWTPRLNLGLPIPTGLAIKYKSEVTYKNNGIIVGHPSKEISGGKLVNNEIKVAGIMNGNVKNMNVKTGQKHDVVGNITIKDVKTDIYKNIEMTIKGGVSSDSRIKYSESDMHLDTWPRGIDTIVIKGGNLYINGNIPKKPGKIKGIIVMKNSAGLGGNVYVKDTVRFIAAAILTDGSLISGEAGSPFEYYADSDGSAQNQIFFKGTIISRNTVGGSYKNPPTCPYGISPCDFATSKRYDFDLFRHFIKGEQGTAFSNDPDFGYEVNMGNAGYEDAPMIIEYDSELMSNPPPGFAPKK